MPRLLEALHNNKPSETQDLSHLKVFGKWLEVYFKAPSGCGKTAMAEYLYGLYFQGGKHFTNVAQVREFDVKAETLDAYFKTTPLQSLRAELEKNKKVVYLDFTLLKASNTEELKAAFSRMMAEVFQDSDLASDLSSGSLEMGKKALTSNNEKFQRFLKGESFSDLSSMLDLMYGCYGTTPLLIIDNIDQPFLSMQHEEGLNKLHVLVESLFKINYIGRNYFFGVHDFVKLGYRAANTLETIHFQSKRGIGHCIDNTKEVGDFEVFYRVPDINLKAFLDWPTFLHQNHPEPEPYVGTVMAEFLKEPVHLKLARELVAGEVISLAPGTKKDFNMNTYPKMKSEVPGCFLSFLEDLGWIRYKRRGGVLIDLERGANERIPTEMELAGEPFAKRLELCIKRYEEALQASIVPPLTLQFDQLKLQNPGQPEKQPDASSRPKHSYS